MNTAKAEQRQSDLIMRDRISIEERLGSIELYQQTSRKDWALQHQGNASLVTTSKVEVMQQSMGPKGRLIIWIGLALMLII